MNASLPPVLLIEDGTMVMDCRKIALFTHLKYPKYLARLRQRLDENPDCWKFFRGLPHPIPSAKSIEECEIWSSWSGVEIMYHDGAARRALRKAFTEASTQTDPGVSGLEDEEAPKATAGDEKFLIVRPSTDSSEPMADSRDVASYFGKRHDNLLQSYKNLGCSLGFRSLNFQEHYINGLDGTTLSYVAMTKNGFAFLALGFTGEKADLFKEAFISKYDSMERRMPPASDTAPDWNDPASLRQILIGYTYKIEEAKAEAKAAQAEAVEAKQETEDERNLRIAAEAKAAAETERALQQEDIAGRERVARQDAEAKALALRKAFSDLADDENLMLPSDAASNFGYSIPAFMQWMEDKGLFKWRRSGKIKIGPAIATADAEHKGIAANKFRPYAVPEKRDEAGNIVRSARKKMTTQAYLTMDGYLWLHQALPAPETVTQGKLPIPRPAPTKH